jgi:hypothetical protein
VNALADGVLQLAANFFEFVELFAEFCLLVLGSGPTDFLDEVGLGFEEAGALTGDRGAGGGRLAAA